MRVRLGLRSRILALTMPVVLLISAALAGIVYLSLGQVLEASARDVAEAEVVELRADLGVHGVSDLIGTHAVVDGTRIVQVVDPATGEVVAATAGAPEDPLALPRLDGNEVRIGKVEDVPGLASGTWIVAGADAVSPDSEHYTLLVGVPTRVEATALGQSTEFAFIGAVGLIALLGSVTTFAVGQALRPVERMRDQVEALAATPTAPTPGPALEVPAGRDELSRLAETMNYLLDRMRRADASRRAFVADAGHELRSPLATIRVLLDRLGKERPVEDRAATAARASAEVDRLAVLVEDLLTLASADEHAMVLQRADVDLDDVVLAETGALRARGMPVSVSVEPVRLEGDQARLGRVVRNLLENAERHMGDTVRVRLAREGDEAVLSVDNDGPPIDPRDRERVFGRFVRLDDSRTRGTGGTGLGLAIVAEVVAAHDGLVEATESPEGWCRFTVRLPVRPPG
ncbi:HAMP domain-containing histidine kinase [Phycicoccus endophyticus]|uniref:histidine kinase n=1 Tax=Phycicoccus endophyticus TaxID=1690220 RepID=A0A7G9R232_9MICO|nr:HAMP domain-containing sensor histidine kinase [Phycicoccus endophyticus]NHI19697.1 HAMP domain-containing histidine kinase [Phycicoccus endophyticus]QNN49657.1 HAMP domain-containing histidine kinase [Phycicoccus endophyticus]GGL33743.1 two-component sensor histidine kinase [Phycicoccus endophyticus]